VRRAIAWVLCLLASAVCTSSARATGDAQLALLGGGGVGYSNSRPYTPYTIGDQVTCLDRPGRVVINWIELIESTSGLRLDDFAVIPNDMERGGFGFVDGNRSLADLGLSTGAPVVVDQTCPDFNVPSNASRTPRSVALLLEYSKPTEATAASHAIVVHYTSGSNNYTVRVAWEMVLCGPSDVTTWGCEG
jgi:hypothetical protein